MHIRKEQLADLFEDKEFRHQYVSDWLKEFIAMQIRLTREEKDWAQEKLADEAETTQTQISRLENPAYAGMSVNTLKKLAKAFDVALSIRFIPFSEFVDWTVGLKTPGLSKSSYTPKNHANDNLGVALEATLDASEGVTLFTNEEMIEVSKLTIVNIKPTADSSKWRNLLTEEDWLDTPLAGFSWPIQIEDLYSHPKKAKQGVFANAVE